MFKRAYQPGAPVPQDATFWVHHYQHRMSHLVSLSAGRVFPQCMKCGHRVRFEMSPDSHQAEPITSDPDFRDDGERTAG